MIQNLRVLLNAIVAERIESFFSVVRPGDHIGPISTSVDRAFAAAGGSSGRAVADMAWRRRWSAGVLAGEHPLAALLITGFLVPAIALGIEIYRCDVLQIPNCD